MKIATTLVLIFLCPVLLTAQEISGSLVDAQTKEAIGFATVYFDGTTRGTTTDEQGQFDLSTKGIPLPANLVVSHLNYELKVIVVSRADQQLNISLEPRKMMIQTIEVADKDQRQRNLEEFRKLFLGTHDWGRKAKISNEEDLVFNRDFETAKAMYKSRLKLDMNTVLSNLRDVQWAKDSSYFTYQKATNFKIDANAPLKIDLPDLGYRLEVDLVHCELDYASSRYSYLGHFYFQPYEGQNQKPKAKHRKNRILAFYNSQQHFFRSLYENELAQNGYKLFEEYRKSGQRKAQFHPFDIQPYLHYLADGRLAIKGLNGKKITIMYYANTRGFPLDVRRKSNNFPSRSGIEIGADSCIIRADGTMAHNLLFFSGIMAQKKVSALLPDDYQPESK